MKTKSRMDKIADFLVSKKLVNDKELETHIREFKLVDGGETTRFINKRCKNLKADDWDVILDIIRNSLDE